MSSGGELRFGVVLQCVDPPAEFVELVRLVEDSGFDYLWLCDSSLHGRYVYAYLALAAANTSRITLGTDVTHPHTRHPAANLNAHVTIDEISGGRTILGIGAGDRPVTELGFKPARVQVVRDMVETSRRLLAGERLTFQNEAWSFTEAELRYKQRADLPIYVCASGPRMLQLAGEVGDGVLGHGGLFEDGVRFVLDNVRIGAERAGKRLEDLDIGYQSFCSIRPTRAEAIEETRSIAAWFALYTPGYLEMGGMDPAAIQQIRDLYKGTEFHHAREAAQLVPPEVVDKLTLAGPPDYCVERLEQMAAWGLRHFDLFPLGKDRRNTIEQFAREALPRLRGRTG